MATNNSSNLVVTNNADGFTVGGGTTERDMTFTGANMTFTGSGTNTYTFPSATDTLVGRASTDTLTNKTLSSPVFSGTATGALTVSNIITGQSLVPSASTIATNGMYLPTTNQIGFATNSTSALQIDASQRVLVGYTANIGIGASNPQIQLAGTSFNTSALISYRFSADAGGVNIGGAKSRNASLAGQTVVNSGDSLINFNGYGSDGTNFIFAGNVSIVCDAAPSSGIVPGRVVINTANAAGASTEAFRLDRAQLATFAQYMVWAGQARVSSQFDKSSSTSLSNITGLSVNVAAGKTYYFKVTLFVDADVVGGQKYAIAGTATATAIVYQITTISNATNALVISSRQTSLGGNAGQAGATTNFTTIEGTITVNAAGTLTTQFAQNAATGTSSVLVGSTFEVKQIT